MTEPDIISGAQGVPSCGLTGPWRVVWEIDIEAASAPEAARKALRIMRNTDPANMAVVFECMSPSGIATVVDLLEPPEMA